MSRKREPLPAPLVYGSIFIASWLVRLAYLAQMARTPAFLIPLIDAGEYHALAVAWAEGQRLPKLAWQPWFYPLVLAQWYRIFGASILAAKLLQITVGSITCMVAAALAYEISPRRSSRWAAGLAAAFYGPLIYHDGELLAEPWAALWLTLAIWLALRYRRAPGWLEASLVGALGALSLFTRPPLVAGWIICAGMIACRACGGTVGRLGRKVPGWIIRLTGAAAPDHLPLCKGMGHLFALLVIGLISSVPFLLAIHSATNSPRLLPTSGGINFYIGNSADPCRTINIRPGHEWENLVAWPLLYGARSAAAQDAFFRYRVRADIRAHPGVFLRNLGSKTLQFVSSREISRNVEIYAVSAGSSLLRALVWRAGRFGFPFGLLAGCAVLGIWHSRPRSSWVVAVVGMYAAAIILVHVCDRYRIPVIPALIALAGVMVPAGLDALRARNWRWILTKGGGVALVASLVSLPGPFCAETLNYQAELFRLIAASADRMGEPGVAAVYARRALEEDPCEAHAWNLLGVLSVRGGDRLQAAQAFQRALACDPAHSPAWFNLGRMAAQEGDNEMALARFRQGLQFAPAHVAAWLELASLAEQFDPGFAINAYRHILHIQPNHPVARERLAALAESGRDSVEP